MTESAHTSEGQGTGSADAGWRFRVGVTIFVLGFAAPLAIPLVVASELPVAWKTFLSGALTLGVPEVLMVAAAAVMGEEGFGELKDRFGRFFKKYGPPEFVSRPRYRVGLAMFTLPLVFAWLGPYVHSHLPGFDRQPLWWHVGADLMFVSSLIVLGGGFWEKLRSLFVHSARADFSKTEINQGAGHE